MRKLIVIFAAAVAVAFIAAGCASTQYISASSGTVEDPTPHGKIFCGKVNKGALSLLPNQQGLPGIARIIQATKSDITASLTDGVAATSSEIQTAGKGAANE